MPEIKSRTITRREYPQINTAELIEKESKEKGMSRQLENLETGFYLFIYKRPEDDIWQSYIIEIITIDKTAKRIEVKRFYGPDRMLKRIKEEGKPHTWQNKKYIKEFVGFDLRYLGITTESIVSDTASRYHPIPLQAKKIKAAMIESKEIAKKLDMPLI